MNTTLKKAGKFLEENKKTILIVSAVVVSIAITIWAGRKIYRFVVSKINETKNINDAEEHTGTTVTPTLQFNSLVQRLFDAMYPIGTNEAEVYNVLGELRTQADWECLKRTWYSSIISLPKITKVGLSLGGTKTSLVETLYNELNASELEQCRQILTSKGIAPDF